MAKALRLAAKTRHADSRTMQRHLPDLGIYSFDTRGIAAVAAAISGTHGIDLAACMMASARIGLAQAALPMEPERGSLSPQGRLAFALHGRPWRRMPWHKRRSEHWEQGALTSGGALEQVHRVLCYVDGVLGSLDYLPGEKK